MADDFLVNSFSPSALEKYFVNDFFICRENFLSAVNQLKETDLTFVESKQWLVDKNQEQVATNAVYIGEKNAKKVLVIISGTHGVEGYCGSAIQNFLLSNISKQTIKLPKDNAIIMLHALNPWGMLWARRCDHQGIDVNRNFVDFSNLPKANTDYEKVLDFLNIADPKVRQEKMKTLVAHWGQTHFDEVFSGGQYQHDWAPFYGGQQASFSQKVVEDVINTWGLSKQEIVVIDLHTGLGPWAYGEMISDHPINSQANSFAKKIFGEAVAITEKGESFSVKKAGLLDYRWHKMMQTSGCFLTLEFGTYGTDALFHTLLNEHLYWKNHKPISLSDELYQEQRSAMMKHFFPRDSLWQQAALFKAWQTVQTILAQTL